MALGITDTASAQIIPPNYWVTANYIAVLGRHPDPVGWLYWVDWLNHNHDPNPQAEFTSALLVSSEYCGLFGQISGCTNPPTDAQFLTTLYQNALGRPPDQGGWQYYIAELGSGAETRAQVVFDLIASTEFANLYGAYCTSYSPGYATPLGYTTTASAVGGAETSFTLTFASSSGSADIAYGQVLIDGCSIEWDGNNTITLDSSQGYGPSTGQLASGQTLPGSSCSINLAHSSKAPVPGNSSATALTLALILSEQNFVGAHEVLAWSKNAEGFSSSLEDLGSLAVTQGPDFTISATPASATLPNPGSSVTMTVTIASVNGFSGEVDLSYSQGPGGPNGTCSTLQLTGLANRWVTSGQSATVQFSIANVPGLTNCANGASATFTIWGTSAGIARSAPTVTMTVGPTADFTVGVGAPYPVTLTTTGTITYQVAVTPLNGFNSPVGLSLSGLPTCSIGPANCVQYSFSPSQLQSGNWVYTLTIWATSANVPGGAFPITATASAAGYQPRTAGFTLSTQVSAVTGTFTPAYNNNQQSPTTTLTITSPNAPQITSCGISAGGGIIDTNGSLTGITCSATTSGSQTVTVNIWATRAAQHGTYVLMLNGGAMQAHAAIGDSLPVISGGPFTVTAGQRAIFLLDSYGVDDFPEGVYFGTRPIAYVDGSAAWAYASWSNDSEISVLVDPPPNEQPGEHQLDVFLCGSFFMPFGWGWETCDIEAAFLVEAAAEPNPRIFNSDGQDITGQTPTAAIGEQISLIAIEGGGTLANPAWQIPGSPVKKWPVSQADYSTSTAPTAPDLSGATPLFYWTVPGSYPVTLTVLDAAGVPYKATTTFSVVGPTYTVSPSTGTVSVAGGLLTYGPTPPGITQKLDNFHNPAGYDNGTTQWVQVVKSSVAKFRKVVGGTVTETCTNSGLDTRYPASTNNPFTDSPLLGLGSLSFDLDDDIAETFVTYLMWSPNNTNAMFVPLISVMWSWSAEASNPAGTWQLNQNPAPSTPTPQQTSQPGFPTWTNVVTPQTQDCH